MSVFSARIERLRRSLRKSKHDNLLVTNFTNVTYLTGFTGDDSFLLLTPHDVIMLTDGRYTAQLQEECPELSIEVRQPGVGILKLVHQVVSKARLRNLAIEGESLTVAQFGSIDKSLPRTELIPTSGLVEALRTIKDRHEIARIRGAIGVAERSFQVIRASLRRDQTELQIANELEYRIRLFGGEGCSFPPIVAVGPRAALPHASPTRRQIGASDFVLIDWGARCGHYVSDLTRVLVTGRISPKLKRVYEVVLKAQLRAIDSIRPGVQLSKVDAKARDVIAKAGLGKLFNHGLGHGIGLEIHEAPRIGSNEEQPLKAGMVVTVEPGVYIPGWGGVRIEDDVLVTRDGHEVLTSTSKDLEASVIPSESL